MVTNLDPRPQKTAPAERVYAPDILPLLQSLLADLADLDLAYRKKLDSIGRSPGDESLKQELTAKLQRHHLERRAFYVQELEALQARIADTFR